MNGNRRAVGLLLALPLLLAGCAAQSTATGQDVPGAATTPSASTTPSGTPASSTSASPHHTMTPGMSMAPGASMSPGMSMAPGASMSPSTPSTTTASPTTAPSPVAAGKGGGPSASAKMICGPETKDAVKTLVGLKSTPVTKTTWVDHLYTCAYSLPVGPLVLSVKESPDVQSAHEYFDALRQRLGRTDPLPPLVGLGLPAYETSDGTVIFLKDNTTLRVDATGLPREVGPNKTSPTHLAYTVATDVLACWTGK